MGTRKGRKAFFTRKYNTEKHQKEESTSQSFKMKVYIQGQYKLIFVLRLHL